ncbi:hypothetical protein A2Y99_04825 [Candidatus Gottesmanbacteria bacterium RBG_13_37_7]|uniref:DUF1189 domain-containing protein n=1 Tax=Candidatus Gottesmanbacteria bacterium RBG_13_37_7 TaxID=1798369 RepID=A0A1F5YIX4_9BACT|nr:MAG: hypothetical protein A2Y99_04825 [Candidatus Gottesmanbacteria bacterium RBG_13_37_7]
MFKDNKLMNKLATFFYVLKKTFTTPAYYSDILKAPFSFSLKFFYFFFFLYSLVATVFLIPKLTPLKKLVSVLPSRLEQAYPLELEVKFTKGEVTTNVAEPYYLPLKGMEKIFSGDKVLGAQTPNMENLLVIDTASSGEDFQKYRTFALLTKKNIIVYDDDTGGYKAVPLKDIPDVTINRQFVNNTLQQLNPVISKVANYLVPVLSLGIFLGLFLFLSSSKLFYLLFFSLIALLLGKILSFPLSYKKHYQMSIHLITIPTILFGILSLLKLNLSFPFLQTIVMIILTFIVLNTLKSKKSAKVNQTAKPPPTTLPHQ